MDTKLLPEERNGIVHLLNTLLGLNRGDSLLFVFDESSRSFFTACESVASMQDIHVAGIYVPHIEQLAGATSALDRYYEGIHHVDGYVVALNASATTQHVRQLFRSVTPNSVSVATMPGFTFAHARFLDYDLKEATTLCNRLLLPLWKGRHVLIRTMLGDHVHELSLELACWDRVPIASTGQLHRGHYGNIPGAESFTAPVEGTAEGTLVVDGSVPGLVLKGGAPVVLEFRAGRLVHFHGPTKAEHILRSLAAVHTEGVSEWDRLGELGIGTNRAITTLTGVQLIDEKAYGTAHVAIGHNDNFGGSIKYGPHSDIVFYPTLLAIDEHPLLKDSVLVLNEHDWLEDAGTTSGSKYADDAEIFEAPGLWQLGASGEVLRVFWDARGRRTVIPVGNERTTALLSALLRCLAQDPGTPATLESALGVDRRHVNAAIAILHRAGIVGVKDARY